jgi:Xaa-Pro aminopeptidase
VSPVSGAWEPVDARALAAERLRKVRAAMAAGGVDLLVAAKSANVRYATGLGLHHAEPSRESALPAIAVVAPGVEPAIAALAAPDTDRLDAAVPAARVIDAFAVDDAGGAGRLATSLREIAPGARRIAIDRLTLPLVAALGAAFPDAEWIDVDALLAPERMVKLADEIRLLRRAQALNEAAIHPVLDAIRPGLREIDLSAAFHARLGELGVTAVHVESVWCRLPRTRAEAPWTPPGAFPYRELTSQRILEAGDLVVMDTGILHEGYMSDFGRTWACGALARPGDAQRRVFERWREVLGRLLEACRPGRTALDLRRAALRGWDRPEPPWPVPLYVAHSIGLGGVEPPFVGTDLGEAVEDEWTLRPGMVMVFEPYVWEEGVGGYRAEETVVLTENGCERFSDFPYGPFAS